MKYTLDLNGRDCEFKNAKKSYKAGERVTLYYFMIATDTNYSFFVDGAYFNPDYETDKGYIISFDMPDHDVVVDVHAKNSMLADIE